MKITIVCSGCGRELRTVFVLSDGASVPYPTHEISVGVCPVCLEEQPREIKRLLEEDSSDES